MPYMPPEYQHAARTAAARVEKLLLEMLAGNETGEVAVVVSHSWLEPEKRVTRKARGVKVARVMVRHPPDGDRPTTELQSHR